MRSILLSSVAALALTLGMPSAFAASPDSATITQTGESGSVASQNQPGYGGNKATISQSGDTDGIAIQNQTLGSGAVGGTASITQSGNKKTAAYQSDGGHSSTQTIIQTNDDPSSVTQVVNTTGVGNVQSASSTNSKNVTDLQRVGAKSTFGGTGGHNAQTINQDAQTGSSITQTADATSNGNIQVGVQVGGGTNNKMTSSIQNGQNNTINQTQTAGTDLVQSASVQNNTVSNLINQIQNGGTKNTQTADLRSSNNNDVQQWQIGGANDTQYVQIVNKSNGNLVRQYQFDTTGGTQKAYLNSSSNGFVGQRMVSVIGPATQSITQKTNVGAQEAGQYMGSATAAGSSQTIIQTGALGPNAAVQNMGGPAYYSYSGVTVTPHS